ncbi:hypothetical protein Tco_0811690 [Tanacetum coccineum]
MSFGADHIVQSGILSVISETAYLQGEVMVAFVISISSDTSEESVGSWKRISDKRTKNEVKNDKTEHGMEKREKDKEKVKAKSKSRSTPTKSKVKTEAVTEEILNGPPLPI